MIDISKNNNEKSKLKIHFVNPNSNEYFEELLKTVIVEKIKNSLVVEDNKQ